MTEEEKKAIEYYNNNEYTFEFETDMNMDEFKKALGIEETEEDSFEKHQMRFKTLINLIEKQQKEIEREKQYSDFYKDLCDKQQKEIEELKKDNNHQWEERCKLTFELENYIDKDKIREKIEKYEKDYERQDKEELFNMTKITAGKLSALQELLEE